jgi:hypothetical protein
MKTHTDVCSFAFSIERFQASSPIESQDPVVIDLEVEGEYKYTPGVTWKLPEDCYPEESETQVISATDENGKSWLDDLHPYELSEIKSKIQEYVKNQFRVEGY